MTESFAGSALLWLLLSFKRLKGFQKYVYYLEISALGHNSLCWICIPKLNVVIYILIMQEGQSRQKHPKCASQKISKGQVY